eukprot:CAMPEP_0196735810 /NCGR_PEP_ID=MMETSP1091-20130531/14097_1 /TAXON_ID=302021 /ORGANISM="Rhodomonas sp., Strain CCMP768" /LENGTH=374 /DNA_ID=CAMNT_0042079481 /DNA_START=162 /DNA_END=1286 /DNA_ORIENTATION=+
MCSAFQLPSKALLLRGFSKPGLSSSYCTQRPALTTLPFRKSRLFMSEDGTRPPPEDSSFIDIDNMLPRFLPPLDSHDEHEPTPNASVIPLFPLGSTVYTLETEHTLNIFEPRYRAMYNDILFSGSRRFAVCCVDDEQRFSQVASVFYLKDLQEVSEQTGDQIKFICEHEVIGRINITKVLNPKAWEDRSTYLKVEFQDVEDEDEDQEQIRSAEEAVTESYQSLVDLQHELDENVKFTKESMNNFNISQDGGLWATISMWQIFQQQRLLSRQQEMQAEFQEKLLAYLMKSKDGLENGLPEVVDISELPEELQAEVRGLQARMNEDLAPLQTRDAMDLQILMETRRHSQRLLLLRAMVEKEKRRLETKKAVKMLFS